MFQRIVVVVSICLLFTLSACATKRSVKKEVTRIDEQMTGIASSVEASETRIQEHDSRLAEQDQKLTSLSRESQEALQRVMAAEKLAKGKLLYEVTLADDTVKFDFDKAQIQGQARDILDNLVNQLKTENANVYVEIQGHTDAVGPEEYNMKLGLERAENVRRYLSESGIPLHRISVISYGEDRPLENNKTRNGRSKNRRVVIQVLT